MNSEEKFKQSLNHLLEAKEFSFDEANWQKAEKVINASKKRGVWPFIFTAIVLLISGFFGFTFFNKPEAVSNKQTAINTEQEKLHVLNENGLRAENLNSKIENIHIKKETNNLLAASSQKNTALNESLTYQTSKAARVGMSEIKLSKTIKQQNAATHLEITKTEKESSNAELENYSPALGTQANEDKKESGAGTFVTEDKKLIAKLEEAKPEPIKNKVESTQDQTKITASANVTSNGFDKSNTYFPLTQVKTLLINVHEDKDIIPSKDTFALRSPYLQNDFKRVNFFSIEMGASYLLGWKNSDTKEANGFNPVFGINYHNSLTQNVFLSIGIQYTSLANMKLNSHTSKVTRYGLGEESKVTVITPNKIQYLVLPIKLNYHINPSNSVGLGCNIAYLLDVESKVETYEEGYKNSRGNYTVSKTKGYTEGFKTFDTQLSVFYKRKLYKNFYLNAEFVYGLSDIKDNTFFRSTVFERNHGIKATLVYNLFKK